ADMREQASGPCWVGSKRERDPLRQPRSGGAGNLRPGRARVGRAKGAGGGGDDDCLATGSDVTDVQAAKLAVAVERRPGGAPVRGAQQPDERPADAAETAEAPRPGNQGPTGAVGRIQLQGAERQRLLRIGELLPGRPRVPGVPRPPDATVDRAHVDDIGVRRVGGDRLDGAHPLPIRDAFDLATRGWPRSLRRPDEGHVPLLSRNVMPPPSGYGSWQGARRR